MNRQDAFTEWYVQVADAAEIDVRELMDAFDSGVTPEEMNAR